jgi:hypothetical protein
VCGFRYAGIVPGDYTMEDGNDSTCTRAPSNAPFRRRSRPPGLCPGRAYASLNIARSVSRLRGFIVFDPSAV